jgi:hypothetical protein
LCKMKREQGTWKMLNMLKMRKSGQAGRAFPLGRY